jgi:hypothetical protein
VLSDPCIRRGAAIFPLAIVAERTLNFFCSVAGVTAWRRHLRPSVTGWQEGEMPSSRKATHSGRAYAAPLFWVALLMMCYWVLAEWPEIPRLLAVLKASLPWPV